MIWACAPSIETEIFIPVEPTSVPSGLCISHFPVNGLKVRVSGSKRNLEALAEIKLKYELDLSGIKRGVQTIPVDPKRIPLPKDITFIEVTPSRLTLTVEKAIQKSVPVTLSITGKPAAGFKVTRAVTNPERVTLGGPETVLIPVEKVTTKPVDVTDRSESFKKEIALDLAEHIEIISPAQMIVGEIFIEEKIVTQEFHHIPVKGKGSTHAFGINPPILSITVKGPENIVKKLHPGGGIDVYVDLNGLKPGVYVRRATITLPVKTTLVDAKPELFTVKIRE